MNLNIKRAKVTYSQPKHYILNYNLDFLYRLQIKIHKLGCIIYYGTKLTGAQPNHNNVNSLFPQFHNQMAGCPSSLELCGIFKVFTEKIFI